MRCRGKNLQAESQLCEIRYAPQVVAAAIDSGVVDCNKIVPRHIQIDQRDGVRSPVRSMKRCLSYRSPGKLGQLGFQTSTTRTYLIAFDLASRIASKGFSDWQEPHSHKV